MRVQTQCIDPQHGSIALPIELGHRASSSSIEMEWSFP